MKLTGRWIRRERFRFFESGPLIDRELELVEPSPRYLDEMVASIEHPECVARGHPDLNRADLWRFIESCPRGRDAGDSTTGRVPAYTFWMRLRPSYNPPVPMAGSINLRIGFSLDLTHYVGQVGYGVFPPARGKHLAERACRLVLPLARRHGMREVWITCNPDNLPSRRTCERLGGELVEELDLPSDHPLRLRGDTRKCRFRINLQLSHA